MSDADLRELERRWRETGSVEDEVRFLAHRLRAGGLNRDSLQLSAHLGHPASLILVGAAEMLPSIEATAALLAARSQEAVTRGLLGTTLLVLSAWERPYEGREVAETALGALESCLTSPSSDREEQLKEAMETLFAEAQAHAPQTSLGRVRTKSRSRRKRLLRSRSKARKAARRGEALSQVAEVIIFGCKFLTAEDYGHFWPATALDLFERAAECFGLGPVTSAVAKEVVPWALGYGNPVGDRVDARRPARA